MNDCQERYEQALARLEALQDEKVRVVCELLEGRSEMDSNICQRPPGRDPYLYAAPDLLYAKENFCVALLQAHAAAAVAFDARIIFIRAQKRIDVLVRENELGQRQQLQRSRDVVDPAFCDDSRE